PTFNRMGPLGALSENNASGPVANWAMPSRPLNRAPGSIGTQTLSHVTGHGFPVNEDGGLWFVAITSGGAEVEEAGGVGTWGEAAMRARSGMAGRGGASTIAGRSGNAIVVNDGEERRPEPDGPAQPATPRTRPRPSGRSGAAH